MITGGVSGGGGGGMLRARRRDVSVKPNRKLDRKSSRGMIYENEELRLRTIHINAEVEQGQNDIKKLRRENEQLKREIWCLREEYDKLEELIKNQKSQEGSDQDSLSEEEEEEEEDDEENSSYSDDSDDEKNSESSCEVNKNLNIKENDNDKDELIENAENQKLSTEKNGHKLHVEFDKLSVVSEEDELIKKLDKQSAELNGILTNSLKESENSGDGIYKWVMNPEVLNSTTGRLDPPLSPPPLPPVAIINENSNQVGQLLQIPCGWRQTLFEGIETTTVDRQNCAESNHSTYSTSDKNLLFRESNDGLSTITTTFGPSSSSENTNSTIIQKTSPDFCISGVVSNNQMKNFGSSDQILIDNNKNRTSINKSQSCQDLSNSHQFNSNTDNNFDDKNLLENTRAFKSQVKIQLSKFPCDIPPKMEPISLKNNESLYFNNSNTNSINSNMKLDKKYEITSFENPIPRYLFPSTVITTYPGYNKFIKSERRVVPIWPTVPSSVDTETQTAINSYNIRSKSLNDSQSSTDEQQMKIKKSHNKKVVTTVSINSNDDHKHQSKRKSSSGSNECYKKNVKNNNGKRRLSSRSQSVGKSAADASEILTKGDVVNGNDEKLRKNSSTTVTSESLPWCACWGNGCT